MLWMALLLTSLGWAQEKMSWDYPDFKSAQDAAQEFHFTSESTKFGLLTTSFRGSARAGELSFERSGALLKNATLVLVAAKIDTDNGARNSKMWEETLAAEKFPTLRVAIKGDIDTSVEKQTVQGTLSVRDHSADIPIEIIRVSDKVFKGSAKFSLKALKVPDPSIAIAKVRDEFAVSFKVTLP